MALNWDEAGYAFDVINFDWDGNEIHNGAIDPIDISRVTCTYKPTLPITALHTSNITVTASDRSALSRTVTSVNVIQRTGTP